MAEPPNVTWKGNPQVQRVKRGKWKFNAQDVTCEVEYQGPYDACLNAVPLIGDVIAGYTAYGVKVADVLLDPLEGSKGSMLVLLRNPYTLAVVSNPDFQQVGDPIAQLQWQPFKRRIESHPLCGTNSTPDTGNITSEHIPEANYVPVDGGWDYSDYLSLIKAGITDYDEKQPLLSLTTFSYSRPTNLGQNNFTLDVPDADLLPIPPGDWQWLRGGDDLTRQDKLWKLVQSWTGFAPGTDRNSPFELLYDTATG